MRRNEIQVKIVGAIAEVLLLGLAGCRYEAPEQSPTVQQVSKTEQLEERREVRAAIAFVSQRGDARLDLKSARVIHETGTYCDVAFTDPEAAASGRHPQGEVFKVDKATLAVTSYGAD